MNKLLLFEDFKLLKSINIYDTGSEEFEDSAEWEIDSIVSIDDKLPTDIGIDVKNCHWC